MIIGLKHADSRLSGACYLYLRGVLYSGNQGLFAVLVSVVLIISRLKIQSNSAITKSRAQTFLFVITGLQYNRVDLCTKNDQFDFKNLFTEVSVSLVIQSF
jgi:hypothetical protein